MAKRARKKISLMSYDEAKKEHKKLINSGHSQMTRTHQIEKYMKSFNSSEIV